MFIPGVWAFLAAWAMAMKMIGAQPPWYPVAVTLGSTCLASWHPVVLDPRQAHSNVCRGADWYAGANTWDVDVNKDPRKTAKTQYFWIKGWWNRKEANVQQGKKIPVSWQRISTFVAVVGPSSFRRWSKCKDKYLMKNSGGAPFLYLCYRRWVLWPVVGTTQQLLGIICRSWHGVEAIPGDGLRKDVEGRWSLRISWYGNIAEIEVGVSKVMIPVTLEFILVTSGVRCLWQIGSWQSAGAKHAQSRRGIARCNGADGRIEVEFHFGKLPVVFLEYYSNSGFRLREEEYSV